MEIERTSWDAEEFKDDNRLGSPLVQYDSQPSVAIQVLWDTGCWKPALIIGFYRWQFSIGWLIH